jgi:3-carboxy-cis,cis-muconate cycloisomerase
MAGLDAAADRLVMVSESLPVQYGGAAGTLAASGGRGAAMVESIARTLGLRPPVLAWHAVRVPVADLAGALGTAGGVVAKVATDLVLLAQTEVAEVTDATPGRGASSAMGHKANPVAAVSARACARRVPGLVATLLASMDQEHERAAGGWHLEWGTLSDLLVADGSAASWLRDALEHAEVHPERMAANLSEPLSAAGTGEAGRIVDAALAARPSHGAGA